jgi:hypothetical protein
VREIKTQEVNDQKNRLDQRKSLQDDQGIPRRATGPKTRTEIKDPDTDDQSRWIIVWAHHEAEESNMRGKNYRWKNEIVTLKVKVHVPKGQQGLATRPPAE